MAWIESNQELGRHPKTRRLARLLGEKVPTVIGYLHLLWWWALDFAQDGNLSEYDEIDIADACLFDGDEKQFVDALIQARFLDQTEDGLVIHDWYDYAGKLIERRKDDAERKRKSRSLKKESTGQEKVSAGCPQDVQGMSEHVHRNSTVQYSTININTDDDNAHTREEKPGQTVESIESSTGIKAMEFAEKAWGRPVAPLDCENIARWCADFSLRGSPEPDEIVIEALRRSSEQGVRKMKYVDSILRDWYDNGVLQVSQILELDRQFEQSKTKNSRAGPRTGPGKKKTGTESGKYDDIYL